MRNVLSLTVLTERRLRPPANSLATREIGSQNRLSHLTLSLLVLYMFLREIGGVDQDRVREGQHV